MSRKLDDYLDADCIPRAVNHDGNPLSEILRDALAKAKACGKCEDGWLPGIEGRDGSYVSSRRCSCNP